MSVLVLAEQRQGQFRRAAFETVREGARLAGQLGAPLHVAALGSGIEKSAAALGGYGATKVLVVEGDAYTAYLGEAWAAAAAEVAKRVSARTLLLAATSLGKDLAPQVAARLGAGLVADCVALAVTDGEIEATRPVFAGKARVRVRSAGAPLVLTLRPNVFPAGNPTGPPAAVERVEVPPCPARSRVVGVETAAGRTVDLTEASIIVSGGRGMGGPENYRILEELAREIGAVVGASRASVDAGWRPHSDQVGQTGKTVSPNLYLAVGISGAIQHLAGMRTSKVIVAINKDPEAPIFKVADYGIVGDLFEVVPALTEAVRKRKAAEGAA
ncbi:MAG: electron transfer flavoprotein subunit alpha/FixB family protein [Planctomycetales bacterium]|nr:electron transfer flavoprotein subunit alpha/FixB family protein [Planctomycetales bacterium]